MKYNILSSKAEKWDLKTELQVLNPKIYIKKSILTNKCTCNSTEVPHGNIVQNYFDLCWRLTKSNMLIK